MPVFYGRRQMGNFGKTFSSSEERTSLGEIARKGLTGCPAQTVRKNLAALRPRRSESATRACAHSGHKTKIFG